MTSPKPANPNVGIESLAGLFLLSPELSFSSAAGSTRDGTGNGGDKGGGVMLRGEQKEGALENVDGENAGELTPIATTAIEDPLVSGSNLSRQTGQEGSSVKPNGGVLATSADSV